MNIDGDTETHLGLAADSAHDLQIGDFHAVFCCIFLLRHCLDLQQIQNVPCTANNVSLHVSGTD